MSDPVAWLIECDDGGRWCVTDRERASTPICGGQKGTVTPLYRRATLTDAEREAVRVARDAYADDDGNAECEEIAAVLSGLLERLG